MTLDKSENIFECSFFPLNIFMCKFFTIFAWFWNNSDNWILLLFVKELIIWIWFWFLVGVILPKAPETLLCKGGSVVP